MNHYCRLISCVATLALLAGGVIGRSASAAPWNADPPCFDNHQRYVDCRNGTVTDTVTGLIWLKQADCLGASDYAVANNQAAALRGRRCGLRDGSNKGDWRLPTEAEWRATLSQAPLEATPFSGVQAATYWSSSGAMDDPGGAWGADPQTGAVLTVNKSESHYGWPVRGHLTASVPPVSQGAGIHAQVATGLVLAGAVRVAVAEFYLNSGSVPPNGAAVGLDLITGPYVSSVEISNGRIDITYGHEANALITDKVLSLTLYEYGGGLLQWRCGQGPVPTSPFRLISDPDVTNIDDLYLPPDCRP